MSDERLCGYDDGTDIIGGRTWTAAYDMPSGNPAHLDGADVGVDDWFRLADIPMVETIFCARCGRGCADMVGSTDVHADERTGVARVAPKWFRWRFCPSCGGRFDYPEEMYCADASFCRTGEMEVAS